ncbi:MAG TPA: hypothetical protein VK558_05510 [Patescibacteria group bacterium]|nr:hypothetical protein [Patescibacteria group bacterium]
MPKTKPKKPAPPKKLSAMDQMIQDCVKKSQARKKSGETNREWRKEYATTLKVDGETVPMSQTPFEGETTKKK